MKFFEYHFHGCAGHKTIELNRAAYEEMADFLLKEGNTDGFLATFSAAPIPNLVECLNFCRDVMASGNLAGAKLEGVYLEGPFVRQPGAMTAELLAKPDLDDAKKLVEAGNGIIRAVALAPELPGAMDLIDYFVAQKIPVSAGHFCCSAEVLREAVDHGLSGITHFCNNGEGDIRCILGRYSTEGPWLEILSDDRLDVEMICDGVHVDPRLVKAVSRVKRGKFIPITDGCAATGMPGKRLRFPDPAGNVAEFDVRDGALFIAGTGQLTGSLATMDRIYHNLVGFGAMTPEEAKISCSETPRRKAGLL
ncbi:MAG: hypothetical protein MJ016_01915 [Victivallaceae bacterium]|nr:hypothetical protein [Victivallaceae bacterium]